MNDDELLKEVRAAVEQADPVPANVVEVAKRAQAWDTELERLLITYDSATADLASSGMRSATSVRDVTFSSSGIELELTIADGQLDGLVTPPDTTVEFVVPGSETVAVSVDNAGRFSVATDAEWGAFVLLNSGERVQTELLHVSG